MCLCMRVTVATVTTATVITVYVLGSLQSNCCRGYDVCSNMQQNYSLTLGAHARSKDYCSCPVCVCVSVCS